MVTSFLAYYLMLESNWKGAATVVVGKWKRNEGSDRYKLGLLYQRRMSMRMAEDALLLQ